LNVVSVDMPPLRDRKEDIPAWRRRSSAVLGRAEEAHRRRAAGRAEAADALQLAGQHPRARERARARRAPHDERTIRAEDLHLGDEPTSESGDAAPVVRLPPTGIALEEIERQALVEALRMANWVQKDAAELLHISRG